MRLWSLHPRYLDRQGLLACWRESLLAQKVVQGKTKGYQNHPQLNRFRNTSDPEGYVGLYLQTLVCEAKVRGYHFDLKKINSVISNPKKIVLHSEQLEYEQKHLQKKLRERSLDQWKKNEHEKKWESNPIFVVIKGKVEEWEKKTF